MGTGQNSAVLKIRGDNAEAQKTIAETIRAVEKMGAAINTQSATAVRAFRSEAEAARELLRQLNASEKQMESLARTTRQVDAASAAHLHRIGGAARMVASGFEGMARTGRVAGEAAKSVLTAGSEIAFMFGPQGAIVGAIGISGLAIYNFFARTRREMEETRKKAEDEVNAMIDSGDIMGLMKDAADIWRGKASAGLGQGGGFTGGLLDLNTRLSAAQERLANARGMSNIKKAQEEVIELKKEIKPLQEQFDRLTHTINNFPTMARAVAGMNAVTTRAGGATRTSSAGGGGVVIPDLSGRAEAFTTTPVFASDAANLASLPINPNVTAGPIPAAVTFWDEVTAGIITAENHRQEFQNGLVDLTQTGIRGFADASVDAFLAFAEGGKISIKGFAQGIVTGIRNAAASKAAFYFAEGLAALGSAVFGNPMSGPGAGFYFKSSGIMAAIAAGAGLAGGGSGGGGGGGGARGAERSLRQSSAMGDIEQRPLELHFHGGRMNPDDPDQVDEIAAIMEKASGRSVVVIPHG